MKWRSESHAAADDPMALACYDDKVGSSMSKGSRSHMKSESQQTKEGMMLGNYYTN